MNATTGTVFTFTAETVEMLIKAHADEYNAIAHAAVEGRELTVRAFKAALEFAHLKAGAGVIEAALKAAKSVGADYPHITACMEQARKDKADKMAESRANKKAEREKKAADDKAAEEEQARVEATKTELQKLQEARANAAERAKFFADIVADLDKRILALGAVAVQDMRDNLTAATAVQNPPPALTDAIDTAKAELALQAAAVTDTVDIEADFAAQREAVHAAKRANRVKMPA